MVRINCIRFAKKYKINKKLYISIIYQEFSRKIWKIGDFIDPTNKNKSKSSKLNKILEELLSSVEIQAVIIADWQGLAIASKLPSEELDKEELIAATTLFSLTGAEDTRKELQDTLLGKRINYLLIMTEGGKFGLTKFMIVCPINNLGYIACVSNKREDMAILIMNMKKAAEKAAEILTPHEEEQEIVQSIDNVESYQEISSEDKKYNTILSKIKSLKSIQPTGYIPPSGLEKEAPIAKGNPPIPKPPQQIKVETTQTSSQVAQPLVNQQPTKPIVSIPIPKPGIRKKFRIKFQNEKQIIFTMIIQAGSADDAIKICERRNPQFKIVKVLEIHEIS